MTTRLAGKTREQIAARLARMSAQEVADLVFSLLEFEQHLTPGEIARRSKLSKRTVLNDIAAGRLVPFFKRSARRITVPISAANAWRDRGRVEG